VYLIFTNFLHLSCMFELNDFIVSSCIILSSSNDWLCELIEDIEEPLIWSFNQFYWYWYLLEQDYDEDEDFLPLREEFDEKDSFIVFSLIKLSPI